eukprot:TRINITY_DN79377_c0_g1_i1.p1 TRINITY_DN79377_c0_g1~~TRINITY_DN79377_c0_g1_i1.p1  ORF type:complete len:175 (-),score=9.80 TRINITY_DN79377_c0_g1_i1:181-705(-)
MLATWLRLGAARQANIGEAAEAGVAAVVLRILRENGPCDKEVIWRHAEEAGVKSKRHMKQMLRWLKERNEIRISCVQQAVGAHAHSSASHAHPGSAAEAAAAARGAGSSAFSSAGAAAAAAAGGGPRGATGRLTALLPAGVKKRGAKPAPVEKTFVYSLASQRHRKAPVVEATE